MLKQTTVFLAADKFVFWLLPDDRKFLIEFS